MHTESLSQTNDATLQHCYIDGIHKYLLLVSKTENTIKCNLEVVFTQYDKKTNVYLSNFKQLDYQQHWNNGEIKWIIIWKHSRLKFVGKLAVQIPKFL